MHNRNWAKNKTRGGRSSGPRCAAPVAPPDAVPSGPAVPSGFTLSSVRPGSSPPLPPGIRHDRFAAIGSSAPRSGPAVRQRHAPVRRRHRSHTHTQHGRGPRCRLGRTHGGLRAAIMAAEYETVTVPATGKHTSTVSGDNLEHGRPAREVLPVRLRNRVTDPFDDRFTTRPFHCRESPARFVPTTRCRRQPADRPFARKTTLVPNAIERTRSGPTPK